MCKLEVRMGWYRRLEMLGKRLQNKATDRRFVPLVFVSLERLNPRGDGVGRGLLKSGSYLR